MVHGIKIISIMRMKKNIDTHFLWNMDEDYFHILFIDLPLLPIVRIIRYEG